MTPGWSISISTAPSPTAWPASDVASVAARWFPLVGRSDPATCSSGFGSVPALGTAKCSRLSSAPTRGDTTLPRATTEGRSVSRRAALMAPDDSTTVRPRSGDPVTPLGPLPPRRLRSDIQMNGVHLGNRPVWRNNPTPSDKNRTGMRLAIRDDQRQTRPAVPGRSPPASAWLSRPAVRPGRDGGSVSFVGSRAFRLGDRHPMRRAFRGSDVRPPTLRPRSPDCSSPPRVLR